MGYRILCEGNVAPQTVRYPEREGHVAFHVREALDLGTSDPGVAARAVVDDCGPLTTDADVLDAGAHRDVTVLYFPHNRLWAYDPATTVDARRGWKRCSRRPLRDHVAAEDGRVAARWHPPHGYRVAAGHARDGD